MFEVRYLELGINQDQKHYFLWFWLVQQSGEQAKLLFKIGPSHYSIVQLESNKEVTTDKPAFC
jgi:hypothetical protein